MRNVGTGFVVLSHHSLFITSPTLAGAGEVLQLVYLFVWHPMYIMY